MYDVRLKKKVQKQALAIPKSIQNKFADLLEDLEAKGPIQKEWANYSKIGKNVYHCHLSYSWVACWTHKKTTIIIEVYYVGSRENAPY